MHMRGEPQTTANILFARDVMKDVTQGLRRSIAKARTAGVAKSQIILDPGIGFGKSFQQNYELLSKLPTTRQTRLPAPGRHFAKGFLGATQSRQRKSKPFRPANASGHRRDGYRQHPRRRPHRPRPRCRRNAPGSPRRRLRPQPKLPSHALIWMGRSMLRPIPANTFAFGRFVFFPLFPSFLWHPSPFPATILSAVSSCCAHIFAQPHG